MVGLVELPFCAVQRLWKKPSSSVEPVLKRQPRLNSARAIGLMSDKKPVQEPDEFSSPLSCSQPLSQLISAYGLMPEGHCHTLPD